MSTAPGGDLCGTAAEAQYGNSKADFIAKLHIALKETAETEYMLSSSGISIKNGLSFDQSEGYHTD